MTTWKPRFDGSNLAPREYRPPTLRTTERFTWRSGRDLLEDRRPISWLVEGFWPEKSYGVLGGAKKTLKSYHAIDLALSVASGTSHLGHFPVAQARPVLYFVGEGGDKLFRYRTNGLARSAGITDDALAGLPLHYTTGKEHLETDEFRDTVRRMLDEVQPGLVVVDSLYNYHPPGIEAANVYERGPMLARLSDLVSGEAALVLVDHKSKGAASRTGSQDLDDLGYAGVSQWADAWALVEHRKGSVADETNRYGLSMQYGSRLAGERRVDVDWDLGRFDDEKLRHEHDPIRSVTASPTSASRDTPGSPPSRAARLLRQVEENEWRYTKEQLCQVTTGSAPALRTEFDLLVNEGRLVVTEKPRQEGGRTVNRPVVGLPHGEIVWTGFKSADRTPSLNPDHDGRG